MVPAEELPRVTAYVGDLVEVKNRGPPEYGRHRHPMADENAFGHRPSDLALGIALKKTYPSWGYMIMHGATTIWGSGISIRPHPI